MTESTLVFPETTDPIAPVLAGQVVDGINVIVEANKILLAEESGTGVREIDKVLKDYNGEDKEIAKAAKNMLDKQAAYKKALDDARNLYRKNVLGEEEQETNEVDKDEIKARRNLVMEAVKLLKSYSEQNKIPEMLEWASSLEIPQVGRQGSSNVGARKPRARVSVNGEWFESFGPAAKKVSQLLSDDETTAEISTSDLVNAWDEAGTEKFDYVAWDGAPSIEIVVQEKQKKSDTTD